MSTEEPYELVFDPEQGANVLHATATHFVNPEEPNNGEFLVSAWNKSNTWVSVVVQVDGGNTIWDSGHFEPNEKRETSVFTDPYINETIKIVRWAPGFIAPGDGGGEIRFTMPKEGSLSVDITVVPG